jgi:transcriptional regulator with XRE-family HTH domain
MENLVRKLRLALGLTQQEFARAAGLSYSAIQNFEGDKHVSLQSVEKLRTLAVQHGLADIALQLSSDEWQVRRVFHPGERFISEPKAGKSGENNARWHQLLDKVLNSQVPIAIQAVTSNLEAFALTVDLQEAQVVNPDPGAAARPGIAGRAAAFTRIGRRRRKA